MKIADERIEQTKNKIYSEMLILVVLIVAVSFIVKSLAFHMELKECMTEYIVMIFAPLYKLVRERQMGVVLSGDMRKKANIRVNALTALIMLALLMAVWYMRGKGEGIYGIFAFVAIFIAVRMIFAHFESKRKERLEKKYEDEE